MTAFELFLFSLLASVCIGSIYSLTKFILGDNPLTLEKEYYFDMDKVRENYKIGTTYDSELPMPNISIDCRKSCFIVYYIENPKTAFIRLCHKSNKKIFMHSETYKNKKFALKKAKQLAEELNTEVIFV